MFHLLPIISWERSHLSIGFKDNSSLFSVNLRNNISLGNQFGGLLDDGSLFHFKAFLHCLQVERFVLVLALNHEDLERAFLYFVFEGWFQVSGFEFIKLAENFDLADVFISFLPFALMKISSSEYNIVSTVLWDKLDAFHVILLDEFPEISINHFLSNGCFVLG